MQIREFQPADADELRTLFYNTVRQVNRRDYSPRQIEVWSSAAKDEQTWHTRLQTGCIYVAEAEGQAIGFISFKEDGYIAALFCHCEHQRKGVGTQLLNHVEQLARSLGIERLSSEVSITARPFSCVMASGSCSPNWLNVRESPSAIFSWKRCSNEPIAR
ncbi:GNAT family N-acetyltransferase [Egbenema bharatensis]|uniref:GNAT family N-acetyltransferase n=1 Tax=Egbenema bharatensis TaxID=3463334 RepID=UPI003A895758